MALIQVLLNGLLLGGIYACIGAGFSMVWGVVNIINILHGSFIVLGAYGAFFAHRYLGLHPFVAMLPLALLGYGLGALLQQYLIRHVMAAKVLVTLTLTFGLNLLLNNIMIYAFSADFRKVVLPNQEPLQWAALALPVDRVLSMAAAIGVVFVTHLLVTRTMLGRSIVAVRMDAQAATLMGVNVDRTFAITFGMGTALALVAGAILSPIFPISPTAADAYLSKAFIVCVLGGLGSLPGVLLGGIVLGLVESLGAYFLGPDHSLTLSFALLLVFLLLRPQGLLGKKGFE
ncbi:branched-chain amino acid ABC transporter permease [Alicycliphilus denitrificans]|uniref:branched-chain amino acid ABC transporter permease n=1 Tax=Alicycliphilus denitrificans TaxID=179636 RepID=UPI003A7FD1D5